MGGFEFSMIGVFINGGFGYRRIRIEGADGQGQGVGYVR